MGFRPVLGAAVFKQSPECFSSFVSVLFKETENSSFPCINVEQMYRMCSVVCLLPVRVS
jgi:hypothetical protein